MADHMQQSLSGDLMKVILLYFKFKIAKEKPHLLHEK
jgi:hypothetical protein